MFADISRSPFGGVSARECSLNSATDISAPQSGDVMITRRMYLNRRYYCMYCGTNRALGFSAASSHSDRWKVVTDWARRISATGEPLRDVQMLAGHSALGAAQRCIEGLEVALQHVMELL